MPIPNRTVSIKGVFAEDALTNIPQNPSAGTSYRDETLSASDVKAGWPFKTIVDSAKFNQAQFEYSTIISQVEKYGFLPWSSLTDYVQGSLCLGSDGVIYQAKQATGPSSTAKDPTTDTANTYWEDFVGKTFVTTNTTQTITGNKTFSGTVNVPTQATTDSSTKAASTAFVQSIAGSYQYGAAPHDMTELFDYEYALVNSNMSITLSESWKNFEEIAVLAKYSTGNLAAYRVSTYWLDRCLQDANTIVWANGTGDFLTLAAYSEATPTTDTVFKVASRNLCYLGKIYGVNRKTTP